MKGKTKNKKLWIIPVIISFVLIILTVIFFIAIPHFNCQNGKCIWQFIGNQYKKDCQQTCLNPVTSTPLTESGLSSQSKKNMELAIENSQDNSKKKEYKKNLKNNGPFYCISYQQDLINYISCVPSQRGNEYNGQNPNNFYDIWGFPVKIILHFDRNSGTFYQVIDGKVTNFQLDVTFNIESWERIFYTSEEGCQEAVNRGACQPMLLDPWQYNFFLDIYPFRRGFVCREGRWGCGRGGRGRGRGGRGGRGGGRGRGRGRGGGGDGEEE